MHPLPSYDGLSPLHIGDFCLIGFVLVLLVTLAWNVRTHFGPPRRPS